ncbi:hypothetical protein EJB05_56891, partial [Eragrostis curvula]
MQQQGRAGARHASKLEASGCWQDKSGSSSVKLHMHARYYTSPSGKTLRSSVEVGRTFLSSSRSLSQESSSHQLKICMRTHTQNLPFCKLNEELKTEQQLDKLQNHPETIIH